MKLKAFFGSTLLLAGLLLLGTPSAAQAQEADTGKLFDKMPPAYKLKVVRPGEQRTSEYFFTSEIAGSGTAALTADKSSHAGRFIGVKIWCAAIDNVNCVVPPITKNSNPLTDTLVVRGGTFVTIPFSEVLPIDTSDSISLTSNVTTAGTSGSEPARVVFEFYTPRTFQGVAGGQ